MSMPYYFRTFSKWVEDLRAANLTIARCQEPLGRETGRPLSLLITARPNACPPAKPLD
jgi:hypothetical protein